MNIHEFKVYPNKPRLQIPALTVLRDKNTFYHIKEKLCFKREKCQN